MSSANVPSYRIRGIKPSRRSVVSVVCCGLAGAALGVFYAPEMPFVFESEAKLLVGVGREQMSTRASVLLSGARGARYYGTSPRDINSYIQLLTSRTVIREVVESLCREDPEFLGRSAASSGSLTSALGEALVGVTGALGLAVPRGPVDRAVASWTERFSAEKVFHAPMVELTCYAGNDEDGERFLERVIEVYMRKHVEAYDQPRADELAQRAVARARKRYEATLEELMRFREATGVPVLEAEQARLVEEVAALRKSIRELRAQRDAIAARSKLAKAALEARPELDSTRTSRTQSRSRRAAEAILAESERELARLSSLYPDHAAWVQWARQRLGSANGMVARQPLLELSRQRTQEDQTRIAIERDLARQVALAAMVESQLEQTEKELAQARDAQARLDPLRARNDILQLELAHEREVYQRLVRARRLLEATTAMVGAGLRNIEVLEPPSTARGPVRLFGTTHRIALVLAGGGLGLLLSLGYYSLRHIAREDMGVVPSQESERLQ